jgi:toxin ParE1/3/4
MAKIIWAKTALNDLDEIADHIARHNASAANQFVRGIFVAIDRLEAFPELGRVPPELRGLPYRELVVRPCRIFYRFDRQRDSVFVVFVMRGERQFEIRHVLERELRIQDLQF